MEEGNKRLGFISQNVKARLPDKFDNIIGSNIITDLQGENSKEIMGSSPLFAAKDRQQLRPSNEGLNIIPFGSANLDLPYWGKNE